MSYKTNRSSQLREALIQLNERYLERKKGKQGKLQIGSFVFGSSHAKKFHNSAMRRLSEFYKKDMAAFSLGFEMGACTFDDYLIGQKQCYVLPETTGSLYQQSCIYLLICRFANIYVLGEHEYFDCNSYSLPCLDSVDNF